MTEEERIQANAANGYIQVASFDGWEILKKQHENGWTYYSNQIGYEGAYVIWDTAVRSAEELITLVNDIMPGEKSDRESEVWKAFGEFCKEIRKQMEGNYPKTVF